MEFYFCGRYVNTDTDEKEVKQDMYTAISHFFGVLMITIESWIRGVKNHLEELFRYFLLTSE